MTSKQDALGQFEERDTKTYNQKVYSDEENKRDADGKHLDAESEYDDEHHQVKGNKYNDTINETTQ